MSQGNNDEVAASEFDDGFRPLLVVARTSSTQSFTAVEINEEDEREMKKQRLKWIVKHKDFKALCDFGGLHEAEATFLPSESQGTANDGLMELLVASAPDRRFWDSIFLFSNEFWHSLWLSLNSYSIMLLLVAAGLTLAIESLEQGKHGWHDGLGILIAVFLLIFFPSVFDFYRGRVEEKAQKIKSKLEVIVERGDLRHNVSVSDIKEGDIIHLKKGDRIPADGLMIRGKYLLVDDFINQKIDPNQNPFLFCGSVVEYGHGVMIAVSTGADIAFGKALIDATSHPSEETFFQSLINKPYEFVGMFSLMLSVTILIVTLSRLLSGKHDKYYNDKVATKGKVTVGIIENVLEGMFLKFRWEVSFLLTALLAMVIGIQHGIPFSISVSLFWWGEKIRRSYGGRSQNLSACGTLGLVSVVCIDITSAGGLSCDEIEVDEFWIGEEKIYPGMEFHPDFLEVFELAARVLRFYSNISVDLWSNLVCFWDYSGLKINIQSLDQNLDIVDPKFFSSKKSIGVLMRKSGNFEANLHLHFNGDAPTVLNMCSQYYDISGRIHDMENQRDFFVKVISDMKTKGLRPIAFACKQTTHHQHFEGGLKLLGFVGLKYSLQKIKMTLKDLKDVGVRIILTSEGELSAATAMAVDFGIQCGSHQVIEGEEFRKTMNSTEIEKDELIKSITLMGKATPEDKLLLLQELKASGHVVAFLGGWTTSDAPTLREADVGITDENWSTEVCRTASDITIAPTPSLNEILKCGRCIYLNIRKFYQIQFTTSVSGLLILLVCNIVSGKSPITAIHLIWVTFIICLLGSLMMVMKLNDEEVRNRVRGRDRNQSLISRFILKKIAIHVLCQALVFLVLEYLGQKIMPQMEEDVRHTMIFNTFILWQIFNLMAAMGLVTKWVEVFKAMLQSQWFGISLVGVLTVQVMVIEFAGKIVNGVKLNAVNWGICCIFASLPLTVEWAKNKFLPVLATLLTEFEYVDFNITLLFFAALMFVFSISFGFHLFL
ncbi:calcium-transporting ATPase 12, plasma membrane-type-like [Benincasa hispida]|uniref:calcium-transporting ATPase 12, plasma membrane-type-like n=1 Tax=Benincasa hispida TaxID=102211 RepID=UPI0019010A0C|nr:calcium-transporting ATPase 12, plasma membrane-type-like [Benincasa hispida]